MSASDKQERAELLKAAMNGVGAMLGRAQCCAAGHRLEGDDEELFPEPEGRLACYYEAYEALIRSRDALNNLADPALLWIRLELNKCGHLLRNIDRTDGGWSKEPYYTSLKFDAGKVVIEHGDKLREAVDTMLILYLDAKRASADMGDARAAADSVDVPTGEPFTKAQIVGRLGIKGSWRYNRIARAEKKGTLTPTDGLYDAAQVEQFFQAQGPKGDWQRQPEDDDFNIG